MDDFLVRDYLFTQVFNFRDLGGLAGRDGRTMRWRRLFRSDSLSGLCAEDKEPFIALGIRTVLDLRRPSEVERDGRVPDWAGVAWRHVYPEHRPWEENPYDAAATELGRYLADRYLDMAEDGGAGLAAAIDLIADESTAPLVVHCKAGKDRTGVVCALTLDLLGVSDVDIAMDYAMSGVGLDRYYTWLREHSPAGTPAIPEWYRPPLEAILFFLSDLRARYGSTAEYLTGAGLPAERIDALRAHLLD